MNGSSLVKFLTDEPFTRVSCGERWMCLNKEDDGIRFIVYTKPYRKKNTQVLYDGHYLSTALLFLRGDVE